MTRAPWHFNATQAMEVVRDHTKLPLVAVGPLVHAVGYCRRPSPLFANDNAPVRLA